MFKRLFWILIGIGISYYLSKKLSDFSHKLAPSSVAGSANQYLSSLSVASKKFWDNFSEAKAIREAELSRLYLDQR